LTNSRDDPSLPERAAHVAALWGFAVAQPLLHLLGGHPEFFWARGAEAGDIVVLALCVAVAPPLLLVGLEWLAGLLSRELAWGVQVAYVAVLAAAALLQLLGVDAWPVALAVGLVAGAAAAVIYVRTAAARSLLGVLSPAPLAFLALFLLLSDVSPIVLGDSDDVQAAGGGSQAPVVLVIFDEFPVNSLMGPDGRVDAQRFPNSARLAADATWYRNTASVEQDTPYAVPAILDGRLPRPERLPVAADHPRNIFSLLGSRYELHVQEDATALCAPALCAAGARERFPGRMRSLSRDVALAYAHLILPDLAEDELDADTGEAVAATRATPRETQPHRYRRLHANLTAGRPRRFEAFVAGIKGGSQPRLHLIHALLPHVPFQYLPSGHRYRSSPHSALPGLETRPGYSVPFLVKQSYARHLLQLGATDRLLGKLLDRLHEVAIYDRALVAVVADHGISFRRGHDRRLVRAANVEDIAPVPFFVKAPGQRRGAISDKPLRTVDVLPTVADILHVRIPWPVDGRSARTSTTPAQRQRRIIAKRFSHVYLVDTPAYERERRAALERKLRLFGTGTYSFAPRPDLVGRRVEELSPLPLGRERAVIARSERYRDVHPARFAPALLVGHIVGGRRRGGRVVAVAVNGRVAATGRTFTLEGSRGEQFSVLIPERALVPGLDRIEVLLAGAGRLQILRVGDRKAG